MMRTQRLARWFAGVGTACLLAFSNIAAHADAGSLRARYDELKPQLQSNSYGRELFIDSSQASNSLQGDVYAVLDHPYDKVKEALQDPNAWCDIMLLPFNTKACQAGGGRLAVRIGRKYNQPVEEAYRLDLGFQRAAAGPDFLETRLGAGQGPFGTRDYRIVAEAIPLDGGHTFMHLSYAYGYGGTGKFAMQAYLATAGANKAGFTSGGMRGAIERNAMRYYLAIDAYLDTMELPAAQRVDQRINKWFAATERYPRQLHEMDRNTYVEMKRQEYGRQTTASVQ
ncbi:hypothetical protein [Ramlibacter alkalitolerans]|uniref:Uncharacterized protein n=1 Tax=Ramlibacter alkalitolerans TaxID=2039631 RepID=A0ABS1JIB1_9BURK|nr:hypothetical protein [Ramlibacter alkalitolerans]MBL0423947.1 hypothetical protein [Ramlibacter alkalitolerans]